MKETTKKRIAEMTLEEKAGLCSGKDFWHLKGVERLGIPSYMVSDGPHGLRKQDTAADHLGINDSIKAVCFPTACATAASFDRKLLYELGEALGTECRAEDVSVILGPGINIKRSPLCGRNFEYFSEDPYLAGQLAEQHVKGVQSRKVGTSLKHFAANNQEYRRMSASSEADERTLREIYLAAFEHVVKEAKPWTVMCSYNRINGEFASENGWLLTEVLRDEWGFEGYVVSDWGAVNDRVKGLSAGLELEMPASCGDTDAEIVQAVREGRLPETVLDTAVARILETMEQYAADGEKMIFDKEKDHALAVKIEEGSAVLLKNEGNLLPLSPEQKVAVIGEFAEKPRYQGGGSSHINSFRVDAALEECRKLGTVTYVKGFSSKEDKRDEAELKKAVQAAKEADVAVIFAGLPDLFESEGYDRTHMRLPECQTELIKAVAAVQKHVAVVLHNGSPIEMPWLPCAEAVLELYLGGQGVGTAAARLLYGKANPSGKLPETFPLKLEDTPSYLNFPGDGHTVEYREGIYVGYRYYDKKKMPVLFPFGFGLSYTSFEYKNLRLSKKKMTDRESVTVQADVTNTGSREGGEIVQLYVKDETGTPGRPVRELKGFEKVFLKPGETKTVSMELGKRAFAWYHTGIGDWYCAPGAYTIEIGKSSREIVLEERIELESTQELPFCVTENTTVGELMRNPRTAEMAKQIFSRRVVGEESRSDAEKEAVTEEMNLQMLDNMPLRAMRSFQGMKEAEIRETIDTMNALL